MLCLYLCHGMTVDEKNITIKSKDDNPIYTQIRVPKLVQANLEDQQLTHSKTRNIFPFICEI
ncbi:hypothetical protein EGT64_12760 [Acinetobacter junii]|nr:hypothetical protein EGT64_12760 [Acinetobacter junii]